jgi:hypothetical protein
VPAGGLGGFSVALEPSKMLRAPAASGGTSLDGLRALRAGLVGRCSSVGLDLDRQFLTRLGKSCAVELHEIPAIDRGASPRAGLVFSLQTAGRGPARRLFREVADAMKPVEGVSLERGSRGADQLVVRTGGGRCHLAVLEDAFAVSLDGAAMSEALRAASSVSRRDRQRAQHEVDAALEQLGAADHKEVAGVFRIDLSHLAGERASDDAISPLLRRHVGYLEMDRNVLRIEILTER